MECDSQVSGCVFDIQHASVVDGPGLRSTVFLKGCPLRCLWCHNPEAIHPEPELLIPQKRNEGETAQRDPEWCGKQMTVDGVLRELEGEKDYYIATGGGVTVSGGEPLFQPEFTAAVFFAARQQGIHTCLDTSGYASRKALELVLPFTDLVLFDYKATGAALHRKLTGVDPTLILQNLEYLRQRETAIILRCPMVPEINDSLEHFEAIARLADGSASIKQVDILPYHHWGRGKPAPLWCEHWGLNRPGATEEDKHRWRSLLKQTGNLKASVL